MAKRNEPIKISWSAFFVDFARVARSSDSE